MKRKEGILQKWGRRKEIDEKGKFAHERNRDERNSKDGRKEDYIVTPKKMTEIAKEDFVHTREI